MLYFDYKDTITNYKSMRLWLFHLRSCDIAEWERKKLGRVYTEKKTWGSPKNAWDL